MPANRRLAVGADATHLVRLAAVVAAGVSGVLVAVWPTSAAMIAAVVIGLGLIAMGRRVVALFHGSLIVILVGYAFLGKGFAYLGVPPLYVGEMVLALGFASLLASLGRARFGALHGLLVLFMAWGAIRTIPYIGTYGIDALRDAVTWAYGLFAIAISVTVRTEHFDRLRAGYQRIIPLFLAWLPISAGLTLLAGDALPRAPGSDVALIVFKAGDSAVHLTAIAAFILLGLYQRPANVAGIREFVVWGVWLVEAALTAALNRAAMLTLAATSAVLLFVRASSRWLALVFVAVTLMTLTVLVDPQVDVGASRAISVGQLVDNLTSVFSNNASPANEATKQWRVQWWDKIVNYTVNGPYFWTGKGFGINLADADGFQVTADGSLRAPHSTHLEILARAGVPGLILWVAFQAAFGLSLLRAAFRSIRASPLWAPIIGWIFVYWAAALIDGSFDVYLGSPQGGIWFWSVIGLGMAAVRLSRESQAPETAPRRRIRRSQARATDPA
ncbi:MAG TPA: O-antigen ligase family protein [Candidatus Saccharimonadales bacterium]|nr:O-antigen ligase family protein [Candidatus Saccharimonadales bacterium]